jgi:hypothetical protein
MCHRVIGVAVMCVVLLRYVWGWPCWGVVALPHLVYGVAVTVMYGLYMQVWCAPSAEYTPCVPQSDWSCRGVSMGAVVCMWVVVFGGDLLPYLGHFAWLCNQHMWGYCCGMKCGVS